jgi:hypothetical protein
LLGSDPRIGSVDGHAVFLVDQAIVDVGPTRFADGRIELGAFVYDGIVDGDNVTLLGAFYDPGAAPLVSGGVMSGEGVAAVPEPATVVLMIGAATLRPHPPKTIVATDVVKLMAISKLLNLDCCFSVGRVSGSGAMGVDMSIQIQDNRRFTMVAEMNHRMLERGGPDSGRAR